MTVLINKLRTEAIEAGAARGDAARASCSARAAEIVPAGADSSGEPIDRPLAGAPATARRSAGELVRAYVALTKPRIIELLLITTLPSMFLAAEGSPPLATVLATLLFGTMSAASANAINCYVDRDIDAKMRRTRRRPLARAQVSPTGAVVFGVVLGVLSTVGFLLTVNVIAAVLSAAAILFYVFVYSLVLKRRTSQNVVWGGIAGCMPVLIGWVAITDSLSPVPFVLFAVVFLWTPPHTWTLAMRYREDYALANVPMLPVVATERRVIVESLAYTWATVLTSLALWPIAGMSPFYAVVAGVLGLAFLAEGHRLLHAVRTGVTGVALRPMRFFHLSNVYLSLLFAMVAFDPLLR